MPEHLLLADWLPVAFLLIMGLAILAYVVLDGYDLGIGILFGGADARWRESADAYAWALETEERALWP